MSIDQFAPALWGFGGALIYAAPRLSACLFSAADTAAVGHGKCWFDFGSSLVIGTISAAAFAAPVAASLHVDHYLNAVCALLGLTANRMAPMISSSISALVFNALNGRLLGLLKGEEK